MFGDGAETPSRFELLDMVRKHSNLLGKTIIESDEDDASDVEMDSLFWHDILDLYFLRSTESRTRQEDDDLLFFVKKLNLHGYGFNDTVDEQPPYFVRRWASKLEKVVGGSYADVDWRRSFYLNLIAHTSYTVTVAVCSIHDLRNHQSGADTHLTPIYKVVKTVYASPSRINFKLDSKKVMTETDQCYCVLLNAHNGAAFPTDKEAAVCSSSQTPDLKVDTDVTSLKTSKLTLFSGFVNYQMVREAYDAGKSRFGNFLSSGNFTSKTDRLYMKGPGGRGEVEVAVSGIADQSQQIIDPPSPLKMSDKLGIGLGTIVRKASLAAKQAYAAASSNRTSDEEMLPLKCSLMSISLPWEHIAHDILFKLCIILIMSCDLFDFETVVRPPQ
ncbi:hypothetical protein ACHQM5_024815 [Ranunculus cassubicifolius]